MHGGAIESNLYQPNEILIIAISSARKLEGEEEGKTSKKIGINVKRHKELIQHLSELIMTSGI